MPSAPKFMGALKDEGSIDEASITDAHLATAYSKLQQEAADNIERQNALMGRVQVCCYHVTVV